MSAFVDGPKSSFRGIEFARSLLFVPADRSDRFDKAVGSGADAVICDLEDAVPPSRKESARGELARWLGNGGKACARINAVGTPYFDADCAALTGMPGLQAVVVPKAEDPAALRALSAALGPRTPIVALIETALGLHRVHDIATVRGVTRLAFGAIDFALDIGATEDDLALLYARSCIVVASRVAGLSAPIDGITVNLDDPAAAEADGRTARRIGFGGKLCIHPNQVDPVNAAFTPNEEDVRQAQRIITSASDGAAGRLDGHMVDKPVVDRARMVLLRAGLTSEEDNHELRRS
jgi:citrate lyase subunit beta/citryl-CoA lyase